MWKHKVSHWHPEVSTVLHELHPINPLSSVVCIGPEEKWLTDTYARTLIWKCGIKGVMCTHHTSHQGGSQRVLCFFSLFEHFRCASPLFVLCVSVTSSCSFSFFFASLSPFHPLLFWSRSVTGEENPCKCSHSLTQSSSNLSLNTH